jgi:hypothetical protein
MDTKEKSKIITSCSQSVNTNTGRKRFKVVYEKELGPCSIIESSTQWGINFTKESMDDYLETLLPSTVDKMAFILYHYDLLKNADSGEIKHLVDIWKSIRKNKKEYKEVKQYYKIAEIIDEIYDSNE